MKRTNTDPDRQMTLFNLQEYERTITEASIDCDGYDWESTPVPQDINQRVYFSGEPVSSEQSDPESTPVLRENIERVYFWLESYYMRQRYLHYRFCHLRSVDGIEQVVKIHIPGSNRSIREGRADMIKDAIASGKSPREIEALIQGWRV